MTTMPRDLERALISAGVPAEEAKAVADGFNQLATKGDLDALREGDLAALRNDFAAFQERITELFEQHRIDTDRRHDDLRADLNQRMEDFRAETLRALGQHQESTDKRFSDTNRSTADLRDDMNKRFDDTNRSIADLRDDMNKRFEDLNRTMWRIFIWMGGVITGLLGVLVYQVFS